MSDKLTRDHLTRKAIVYVRQSTMAQVTFHTESGRLQYGLTDHARRLGFVEVEVIDEDLGRSGSGVVRRPGFERLVASVCAGEVGAVLCIEASRLARNSRDWHHLVDLCGLTGTLLVDPDGVYDPRVLNDRLLLGLKGTMSEFELALLRQRSLEAARAKARRGELQFVLPAGLCWSPQGKIELAPDLRIQQAIHLVFEKFAELGSLRQVLLWFREEDVRLPVLNTRSPGRAVHWTLPAYHNIQSIVTNPLYAGAYAFGRTRVQHDVRDGRERRTRGHRKQPQDWMVLIPGHHPGYIEWATFERNQATLAENAHMITGAGRKAGRGGKGLLTGLMRCGRCGRRLRVAYPAGTDRVRYWCVGDAMGSGRSGCIAFGGVRIDRVVSGEVLQAVDGPAIDAAIEAAAKMVEARQGRRNALELELEQARYDARLAGRRYEQVDPDNRLVAGELESRWNGAMSRVKEMEKRLEECDRFPKETPPPDPAALVALAADLPAIWNAPLTDNRLRQRIVRILIEEIIADVSAAGDKVDLVIHWKGGRHTRVSVPRPRPGEHGRATGADAEDVVRRMAGRSSDATIARTLHRLGLKTGAGNNWNEGRIRALRSRLHLPASVPSNPSSALTINEAAERLGIHPQSVARLARTGILEATQIVPCAPWEIPPQALDDPALRAAVAAVKAHPRYRTRAHETDTKTQLLPFM